MFSELLTNPTYDDSMFCRLSRRPTTKKELVVQKLRTILRISAFAIALSSALVATTFSDHTALTWLVSPTTLGEGLAALMLDGVKKNPPDWPEIDIDKLIVQYGIKGHDLICVGFAPEKTEGGRFTVPSNCTGPYLGYNPHKYSKSDLMIVLAGVVRQFYAATMDLPSTGVAFGKKEIYEQLKLGESEAFKNLQMPPGPSQIKEYMQALPGKIAPGAYAAFQDDRRKAAKTIRQITISTMLFCLLLIVAEILGFYQLVEGAYGERLVYSLKSYLLGKSYFDEKKAAARAYEKAAREVKQRELALSSISGEIRAMDEDVRRPVEVAIQGGHLETARGLLTKAKSLQKTSEAARADSERRTLFLASADKFGPLVKQKVTGLYDRGDLDAARKIIANEEELLRRQSEIDALQKRIDACKNTYNQSTAQERLDEIRSYVDMKQRYWRMSVHGVEEALSPPDRPTTSNGH